RRRGAFYNSIGVDREISSCGEYADVILRTSPNRPICTRDNAHNRRVIDVVGLAISVRVSPFTLASTDDLADLMRRQFWLATKPDAIFTPRARPSLFCARRSSRSNSAKPLQ